MCNLNISTYFYNNLESEKKAIIDSYNKIDVDTWINKILSYQIINYILKKINISDNLGYQPELIERKLLTKKDMSEQIENAKELNYILNKFPKATSSIIVYRGFYYDDYFSKIADKLLIDNELIIPYFLSTTIKKDIAYAFTGVEKKFIWYITILKGNTLCFINKKTNCGECEVLINLGSILKFKKKYIDSNTGAKILEFELIGFSKLFENNNFWEIVNKKAIEYTYY
jgi:hypothetical protein